MAGVYAFNEKLSNGLKQATNHQFYRGPDEGNFFYADHLGLGHRRLKIFDLTEQASQPMVDEHLGLALVFNGAIYNFPELKVELQNKGYKFFSRSDTEVIMKAYHAWGLDCIQKIEGMFAFAIWESQSGKLILARDRLGIKPLYYNVTSQGFKFASTLPALLQFEDIDTAIHKEALHYYLMFHAVPEPLTLMNGVKKLSPGSVMIVHPEGKIDELSYWNLTLNHEKLDKKQSEEAWFEATEKALSNATKRQLMADVPVGILLSGGLDSSLLVALAKQYHDSKIKTFSIGFESMNGESGDEFYYSDRIANTFNTEHYKFLISNQQLNDSLESCITSMSEPMLSHDNIGFFLLAQEVSKHVKVVLSGQGADELFGGYHWFQNMPIKSSGTDHCTNLILNQIADRSYSEYKDLISPNYQTDFLAQTYINQLCKRNGSSAPIDNLMLYESTFALSNGPLGRVDNMTMASSLEARVPFLDEKVIDLAARLPLKYKIRDQGKYILKKISEKHLPHDVVHRPKGYFPVPALKYLKGSTLELIRDALSPENVKKRGIFNPKHIESLLNTPNKHLTPSGASKLWQVGLLECWFQQMNV